MRNLFRNMPQTGVVEWIGLRPGRREPINTVESCEVDIHSGLLGDRYQSGPDGKRMVTLIQAEHLETMAKILRRPSIDPALLRRNIVVSGINLLAFKAPGEQLKFLIGTAVLQATGVCHPCSRMEENLGEGGYNAMRGHGGINATVVLSGTIQLGDSVRLIEEEQLKSSNERELPLFQK